MTTPLDPPTRALKEGFAKAQDAGEKSGAFDFFNSELIKSGLLPDAIVDMGYITPVLGVWMGRHLRSGVALDEAIADLDVIAASSIETLLEESVDREKRVEAIMMKAVLTALEACCEPGRVVEAATFIIRTTSAALQSALDEQPASA